MTAYEQTEWQQHAACRDHDPDLFFSSNYAAGKQVCAGCPVRTECLRDALSKSEYDDRNGIYGGLTPTERRRHRHHQPGCTCLTEVPVTKPPERWLPVPGYPFYEVSDHGSVRSLERRVAFGTQKRKVPAGNLTPVTGRRGHLQVVLYDGHGHGRTVLLGRLVLTLFDREPLPGATVLYGPGGKTDCSLRNLRWSRKPAGYWAQTTAFSGRYRGEPRSTAKHRQSPSQRKEAS